MQTLMELTERRELLLTLVEQLEDGEGEFAQANERLISFLADTEGDWQQKVDDYVAVTRSLRARAKLLREEASHLTEMARGAENQADRLKERVVFVAQEKGWDRLVGHKRTITISESGFSVHLDRAWHVKALLEQFRVCIPATWRVDKKAIAAHIKATGETPEGIRIVPTIQVRFR